MPVAGLTVGMTVRGCGSLPDDHGEAEERHGQERHALARAQRRRVKGNDHEEQAPGCTRPAGAWRPDRTRGSGTRRAAACAAVPAATDRVRRDASPDYTGAGALEAPAPGVGAGVRGTRGGGPERRLRAAPGRGDAVPGAGPPVGVRQRGDLLGVFLRRPLLAGAGRGGRRAEAVRPRRARRAVVVRGRREAVLLRPLARRPGGHVLLRPSSLRRDRGAHRPARRRLLVRAGRLRAQAVHRVRGHGTAAGAVGAERAAPHRRPARGAGRRPGSRCWRPRSGCSTPPWRRCCSASCSCARR